MTEIATTKKPVRFYPFVVPSLLAMPEKALEHELLHMVERDLLLCASCDYAWIAAVYGHEGASCKYPCCFCRRTDDEIQVCKECDGSGPAALRTNATMLADLTEHLLVNKGKKGMAKHTGSIHCLPIFEVDPRFVAPIPLHIGLGVWMKLYDKFLDDVRTLLEGESSHKKEARSKLADAALTVDSTKTRVEAAEVVVKTTQDVLKAMSEPIVAARTAARGSSRGARVAIQVDAKARLDNALRLENEANTIVATKMTEIAELKIKLVEEKAIVASLEDALGEMGVYEKELEAFLVTIGVCRQAYFSGAFVGNHVKACLRYARKLSQVSVSSILKHFSHARYALCTMTDFRFTLQVIVEYAEKHDIAQLEKAKSIAEKHYSLWKPFARIHLIIQDPKVISLERVEELKSICPMFVKLYCEHFPSPGHHKSLKLHLIEYHIVEWIERFSSLGLFSEEACECMHAHLNSLHRMFCQTKGEKHHLYVMEALREKQDTVLRASCAARKVRRTRLMKVKATKK
jgi:hypothetical protein